MLNLEPNGSVTRLIHVLKHAPFTRSAPLGHVLDPVGRRLPAPLDFFIVNVALPSIQGELGTSSSAEQLVISSYAACYAVTLITGGRLGDLFGRGRMFFSA